MAANYTILVDDKEVNAALASLLNVLENAEPVMKSIGQEMGTDVQDHFRKQTGPDAPWLPSKRAKKQNGQTLRDTGHLVDSLNPLLTPSDLTISRTSVELFTPLKYAPVHNFGLTIPNRNGTTTMPKREFMWLSKNAIAAIVGRLKDAVTEAWNTGNNSAKPIGFLK